MIKFENTEVMGWEAAIRGMRNSMNSWEKSDTGYIKECSTCKYYDEEDEVCRADDWSGQPINTENCYEFKIGPNDMELMRRLAAGGPVHAKYRRMITVYVDITAPLYWWKEFDTYKVGTVVNICSTMHKIVDKEFTLEDFSCEHLFDADIGTFISMFNNSHMTISPIELLERFTIPCLNHCRTEFIETKDKKYWWQMIQLLPSSYNQKRTVMMNYEVLANIYKSRKDHKLDEWAEHEPEWEFDTAKPWSFGFCDWIKTLPYSELITGKEM